MKHTDEEEAKLVLKVTLREVAAQAGVSITTASRALSTAHHPSVGEETAAAVRRAAAQLGYEPGRRHKAQNGLARFGCIISDTDYKYSDPFYSLVVAGMEQELTARQAELSQIIGRRDLNAPATWNRLVDAKIQGLLVTDTGSAQSVGAALYKKITSVLVGVHHPETSALDVICVDAAGAVHEAVNHLLALGHKRIGHIAGGGDAQTSWGDIRTTGYIQSMARTGVESEPGWIASAEWTWTSEGGYRAMQRLLKTTPRLTAVFAASDRLALGAVRAITDAGFSVPRDISVVGFDDIEMAAFSHPALTTISVPKRELGQMAVKILFDRIAGELPPFPVRVVLPTHLVVRESTCAPA